MTAERRVYEANVGFVPPTRPGTLAGIGLTGVAVVSALASLVAGAFAWSILFFGAIVTALAVLVLAVARRLARPALAGPQLDRLVVDDDALVVERRAARPVRVRRGDLRAGVVVPEGHGARVYLHRHFGATVEACVASIDEARALLADLRLSAAYRPATYTFFFDMHVTVGADGVLVRWPLLRRRRFLPHSRIDDVRWGHDHVTLVLVDGDGYDIATNPSGKAGASSEAHAALVERLLDARRAYAESQGGQPVAALARGGRSAAAWVRELRAMSGGGQYRSAALPADALYRVALDPAEPEEHRIGAGLALRAALDDEGRARLRLAAEASASPRVRVALAAAADDVDDDTMTAAVEGRGAARSP